MSDTVGPLRIVETVLGEAQASLLAARMRTEDMLPIAEALDAAGYAALDVGGGATFATALRDLREDPWERLELLHQRIRRTPLQMLLRGRSLVGEHPYADDVVERFIDTVRERGIEIFRVFDPANDTGNLEVPMRAVKRCGGQAQAAICYPADPLFEDEGVVDLARLLAQMGASSICLLDTTGLLRPADAGRLIDRLKRAVPLPIALHSRCTGGLADFAYLRAIDAGVDSVDCATGSLAGGTSQPAVEAVVATLTGTPRDTGLDPRHLQRVAEYFSGVRRHYVVFDSSTGGLDVGLMAQRMLSGLESNLLAQLREHNPLDRLGAVLDELGWPRNITRGAREYILAHRHRPAAAAGPELHEPAAVEMPAETHLGAAPEPDLPELARLIASPAGRAEDALTEALFPTEARRFFAWRDGGGPERQLVAAVAAALFAASPPRAPARPAARVPRSAWRLAGRRRAMR